MNNSKLLYSFLKLDFIAPELVRHLLQEYDKRDVHVWDINWTLWNIYEPDHQ